MNEQEMKQNLIERLARLEALTRRQQVYQLRSHGPYGNPHRGQGRVLAILKLQPEITQKELGYLLDIRNQSLGELLAKLERSGYITRTPSQEDRRVMNIKLTPEGAAAAEKQTDGGADMDSVLDVLGEEEQSQLCAYLDKLIGAMEKNLDELGAPEWDKDTRFGPMAFAMGMGGPHSHGRKRGPGPERGKDKRGHGDKKKPQGRGEGGMHGRGAGPGHGGCPHGGPGCGGAAFHDEWLWPEETPHAAPQDVGEGKQ